MDTDTRQPLNNQSLEGPSANKGIEHKSTFDSISNHQRSSSESSDQFRFDEPSKSFSRIGFETSESKESFEKLDPLSKDFPCSIPSKNNPIYLAKRESLLLEDFVETINKQHAESRKQSILVQSRQGSGSASCNCSLF